MFVKPQNHQENTKKLVTMTALEKNQMARSEGKKKLLFTFLLAFYDLHMLPIQNKIKLCFQGSGDISYSTSIQWNYM